MRQSLKGLHFYAPAIFVALILFDEIVSIFSLSLNTEHSEFAEHANFAPIEFNKYNVDELQPQSRDGKLYEFESTLNHDFNADLIGLKKVSDCVNIFRSILLFSFFIV